MVQVEMQVNVANTLTQCSIPPSDLSRYPGVRNVPNYCFKKQNQCDIHNAQYLHKTRVYMNSGT